MCCACERVQATLILLGNLCVGVCCREDFNMESALTELQVVDLPLERQDPKQQISKESAPPKEVPPELEPDTKELQHSDPGSVKVRQVSKKGKKKQEW